MLGRPPRKKRPDHVFKVNLYEDRPSKVGLGHRFQREEENDTVHCGSALDFKDALAQIGNANWRIMWSRRERPPAHNVALIRFNKEHPSAGMRFSYGVKRTWPRPSR